MVTEDFACSKSFIYIYSLNPQNRITPILHRGNRSRATKQCDRAIVAEEGQGQSVSPESGAWRPAQP